MITFVGPELWEPQGQRTDWGHHYLHPCNHNPTPWPESSAPTSISLVKEQTDQHSPSIYLPIVLKTIQNREARTNMANSHPEFVCLQGSEQHKGEKHNFLPLSHKSQPMCPEAETVCFTFIVSLNPCSHSTTYRRCVLMRTARFRGWVTRSHCEWRPLWNGLRM